MLFPGQLDLPRVALCGSWALLLFAGLCRPGFKLLYKQKVVFFPRH